MNMKKRTIHRRQQEEKNFCSSRSTVHNGTKASLAASCSFDVTITQKDPPKRDAQERQVVLVSFPKNAKNKKKAEKTGNKRQAKEST